MSLVEAMANVVVGYVLAIVTQMVVFPWFGLEAALGKHLEYQAASWDKPRHRQDRMAPRRAVPTCWLHRHQPAYGPKLGGAVL